MKPETLIRRHMPTVFQSLKQKYDLITPINFGEYVEVFWDNKPTAYYEIRNFDGYILLVCCFFHYRDTQLFGHKYDFEGFIKVIDKETSAVLWGATRFHYQLRFFEGDCHYINIEGNGHGIRPGWPSVTEDMAMTIPGHCFNFELMTLPKFEDIYTEFAKHGVTPWQQWNDSRIEDKFGMKQTRGLIYSDPAKLFKLAKECRLV